MGFSEGGSTGGTGNMIYSMDLEEFLFQGKKTQEKILVFWTSKDDCEEIKKNYEHLLHELPIDLKMSLTERFSRWGEVAFALYLSVNNKRKIWDKKSAFWKNSEMDDYYSTSDEFREIKEKKMGGVPFALSKYHYFKDLPGLITDLDLITYEN